MNKYFTVEKPFRIYRHVGHSASNTYIGRSRAINTVMEARNAKAGDEIHALVGGTFLVRGGETWEISLRPPKPLLEKSYGGASAQSMLAGQTGLVREIPKGTSEADYSGSRKAIEANILPELHAVIIHVELSPEAELLEALFHEARDAAEDGKRIEFQVDDNKSRPGAQGQFSINEERGGTRTIDVAYDAVKGFTIGLPENEALEEFPFTGFRSDDRGTIDIGNSAHRTVARILADFVNRNSAQVRELSEHVDEESNIAAFRLQKAVGQTDGGLASMYWCGTTSEEICLDIARAVIKASNGKVVDQGSPWRAVDPDMTFDHSEDLDEEPAIARDLFLDNVEKRFGVKLGPERDGIANRLDLILEPYFDHERSWAEQNEEEGDAPTP